MSVIGIWIAKVGRDGSGDSQYTRTYTLPLLVRVDDYNDDALIIRNYVATLFPLGSGYINDPGAVVQGYRESQSEDWQIWNVEVTYSSKIDIRASFGASGGAGGSGGGGAQNADPLLRAPEISFSMETYQEALTEDFENPTPRKLQNSAEDPFFPPVTIERRRMVMTVKVNKLTYDPLIIAALLDFPTINDDIFLNYFGAGTLHFCDHTADSLQENAIWYWVLTHKFRINSQGWNPVRILDQGFRLNTTTAGLVPIRSDDGQPITQPARLDGNGGLLASTASSEHLPFKLFLEANYAVLL